MKRIGFLFDKIISIENLLLASKNASRGKSKYKSVKKWNADLQNNIQKLHEELKNETYQVSEYSVFKLYEPKERVISRLPFKDRVVHHAIMIHLIPILQNNFISQTYACIRNRGILKCSLNLRKYLRNPENRYVLKCDIKKFYPSIDNQILKQLLRTKLKDNRLLGLLDRIIDSNPSGLPLGNFTSQWFGNFYLSKFDHWLKENERIKYYQRYCDDLVILANCKKFLYVLREKIQMFLSNFKLSLSKYQIFPIELGIDFVGYKHFATHTLLRKSIKQNFVYMIKHNFNQKSTASYYGWLTNCNGKNLFNKYVIQC